MSSGIPTPLTQLQERPPNFRSEDGRLFLVRCFACDIDHGVENWAMAVASGQCAWCGWQEDRSPPTGVVGTNDPSPNQEKD